MVSAEAFNLDSLATSSYLDETGNLPAQLKGKIGTYAIFDQAQQLQYVGISRDIATSLLLHLVRVPERCYWVKAAIIERPSRTLLTEIKERWIAEKTPPGNGADLLLWEEPLNGTRYMTPEEQKAYEQAMNEGERDKVLKNVARRLEQEVQAKLEARGLGFSVRFDPKAKNQGILDLKV
ncbi:GIY-YIG nuclease family protein [Leptolyngbya sp. FACHB-261]|uniref:GIY-YIG nuclease family protein n=1 Tax=Leptolyngbya sp. FACHB-261 TaxID=2692806 RepID=UPI0016831B56|nr:GIY-YIG nuclease family protein [Leptolyngbya sp. FACHB-261]MBD2099330.1 GIY-YIG nuclease family protein [Leptolyngbya sp. FACHB-261]